MAKIRLGKYQMPEIIPHQFQNLIFRILCPDGGSRATIGDIKGHPAFLDQFPMGYCLPAPIPLLTSIESDPIEPDAGILRMLEHIGYESVGDGRKELASSEHTMAKVFCGMLRRNQAIESLPWPSANPGAAPMGPFEVSPLGDRVGFDVGTGSPPELSLIETMSFGRRACWVPSPPLEKALDETESYVGLKCGVSELMAGLQKVLAESGYEFFHPNPLQLIARNEEVRAYVVVGLGYEVGGTIGMKIRIPLETKHDFGVMIAIDRLVGSLRSNANE
jgi:hypothetical protein